MIGVLREKDGVKKTELKQLAAQKGIDMTDTLFTKVIKDLCTSKGAVWSLKTGA